MRTRIFTNITAPAAERRASLLGGRRWSWLPLVMVLAAAAACGGDAAPTAPPPPPPPPPPPVPTVLLKDVEVAHLPSPYYHFEYDEAGRVKAASFASGFTMYDVTYDAAGRIEEMRNNILVNHDRLVYAYDGEGRVAGVRYVDASGATYTVLVFSYDGQRLTGLERDRRVEGGFVVDKTMSFSYYPDGNLRDLTDHRLAIAGLQDETTTVDHYEQYDGRGINVDGFGLLHNDFFDHLVLLPDVQLQKGNPLRETRTGDGLNYTVTYTYTYDDRNRPLTKNGVVTITNGQDVGRRVETSVVYSYY